MPKDVPPRPGTPEYEEHKKRLEGRSKVDARPPPKTGRASEGLTIAQCALATHEVASGLNHPWTRDSARVTADALDGLGRAEEAKALREKYGLTEPEKPKSARKSKGATRKSRKKANAPPG
jgi:hypothetical protein